MKSSVDANATPFLLILAATVAFYFPALLPGRVLLPVDILCGALPWHATPQCTGVTPANPVLSDQIFQFFPWRAVVQQHGWQSVFWNPYAFAGSPMAGNSQSALFYPANWLHFLAPPSWSYVLVALFHTVLAGVFTYLFARRSLSADASALAAVAYVFSFTFVFSIGYPLGPALAWMPVLFWAVAVKRTTILAFATAMELLTGQGETAVGVFVFLGGYCLWQRPSFRETVRTGVAVALGALVAMPQLLLTYRYLHQSAAAPLRAEFKPLFYSAHTLLEFLMPGFFGSTTPQIRWASNESAYIGVVGALLVVAWLVARPRDAVRNPFLWMLALSLAFIYAIPPFIWILNFSLLKSMFVTKFWGTATFAAAMLAGFAFDAYRKGHVNFRALVAIGALFVAIGFAARYVFADFTSTLNLAAYENRVLIVLALTVMLSLAVLRKAPTLALLVLFAECFYHLHAYNTAAFKSLLYPSTPVVDFLRKDTERFRIAGSGVFPANTAGVFGLEDVRGYDALTPRRYFEYMSSVDSTFPDLDARIDRSPAINRNSLSYRDAVARPTRYWGPAFTGYLKRVFYWNESLTRIDKPALLDLLNVKYYLVPHGHTPPTGAAGYRLAYSGEVDAYENPSRLPRAFVVRRWETVGDEPTALQKIRLAGFDPHVKAILCCRSGIPEQFLPGEFEEANVVLYTPAEVRIEANGPGVLILADEYFPGWRAEGRELYQADFLFRGVVLGPGVQTVTFTYHPFKG